MKCFLLILTLLLLANFVSAKDSDWVGIYTFDEESWDETGERTSYWFRLEIKESDGRLDGIYSDGINGATTQRFEVSVKTEGKKARIFYEKWLPRVEGTEESCAESEFTGGELLFEFEEAVIDGEPAIYTIWQKMNLAVRTETGGAYGRKSIFFRKIYIKKHPLEFVK
jgi:hypothetical protein